MKRLLAIIFSLILITPVLAAQLLDQYSPGFRLIDGNQLNKMVDNVNALTGNGTANTVSASNLSVSGNLTLGSSITTAANLALYVKGVASGYKVAHGQTPLDGTNPTTVATGLATLVACNVSIMSNTTPGLSTSLVTYQLSGTNLDIYGWKPTTLSNVTLIASSGTDTIGWSCFGT